MSIYGYIPYTIRLCDWQELLNLENSFKVRNLDLQETSDSLDHHANQEHLDTSVTKKKAKKLKPEVAASPNANHSGLLAAPHEGAL